MDNLLSHKLQANMKYVKKQPILQVCKHLFCGCFLMGFIVFLILGRGMLEKLTLLDLDSLKAVEDLDYKENAYGIYVLIRRMFFLILGAALWWWGFGKIFLYGIIGVSSLAMGACMYTCLMRYQLKGLFLCFFLYFPHTVFYAAACICGMIILAEKTRSKPEKLRLLWKNSMWLFLLLVLFFLGIYLEIRVNAALLQDYLELF